MARCGRRAARRSQRAPTSADGSSHRPAAASRPERRSPRPRRSWTARRSSRRGDATWPGSRAAPAAAVHPWPRETAAAPRSVCSAPAAAPHSAAPRSAA
eukprot:scaffold26838_cov51-Phaeocystis_antarctica.AAC.1